MLRQASNWAVLQERVVGARTILFRLANAKASCCCVARTFLRRVTNFRYSNVGFFELLSLGVLCVLGVISLFVTALRHFFLWISFELPFTVLCVLGGPSLSVPALLFLFLTFCESFRILCARTREVFWKAESLLPPETNSAEKFRGAATVTVLVRERNVEVVSCVLLE